MTKKNNADMSEDLLEAVKKCVAREISVREASRRYKLSRATITRYLAKCKKSEFFSNGEMFTAKEEGVFKEHLMVAGRLHYGLTKRHIQQLAYEWAKSKYKIYPPMWDKNGCAGDEWTSSFIQRNPEVFFSYEDYSPGDKISLFFENYHKLVSTTNIPIENIWNCDEFFIGDNADNGVNLIAAISAAGSHTPPMMVLPLEKYTTMTFKESPIGTIYGANPNPAALNTKLFINFLKHFKEQVKSSIDNPVILLLDDNDSHVGIEIIEFAISSGILLLTFPRIPNRKLQPLDNLLFVLLKNIYDSKVDFFKQTMRKNVTFTGIIEFAGVAFSECFNEQIIQQCFEVTGIYPVNEAIVNNEDFKKYDDAQS